MSDLVQQIADAIFRVESGGRQDSLAVRNNNPGNLRSWGNYPVVDGYVQFPDFETGMAALRRQVQRNIGRGLTLYEFFGGKPGVYGGYAPAADSNHPQTYAETVARWVGIPPDIPLGGVADPQEPPASAGDQPAADELSDSWSVPNWAPIAAGLALAGLVVLAVTNSD